MPGAVFYDALGLVKGWINGQTATLVGAGKPLSGGAFLRQQTSRTGGPFAVLTLVGGAEGGLSAEHPGQRARISAVIIGSTLEGVSLAAAAYANALAGLRGAQPGTPGVGLLLYAADIAGPLQVADQFDRPRQSVDADFYLQ
jgi:hypothetical protein